MKFPQWCPILWDSMDYPWNPLDQNTGVGSLSLLQGTFPAQGLKPGLSHCRQILYQLSHKGKPRILEWVAYAFFRGSSWPRNWTRVSCIAGRFFTSWATGKPCNTLMFSNKCNFYYTSHKNTIVNFIMLHSTLLKMTLLNQDKFHSFLKPITLSKFWIAFSQQGQL